MTTNAGHRYDERCAGQAGRRASWDRGSGGSATGGSCSPPPPSKNPGLGVARALIGGVIAAAGVALLFAGAFIAAESIGETRHPPGFYYFDTPSWFIAFGLFVGALGILGLYGGSRLGGWWQLREHISRIALALVGIASASFVIIAGLAWGDSGCGGEELAALEAMQHYDDVRYSRVGGSEGVCFVTFPAEHDRVEVLSYYTRELAAQGWTYRGGGMGLLDAERGDLRFQLIHSGSFPGESSPPFFEIIVSSATNVDPPV